MKDYEYRDGNGNPLDYYTIVNDATQMLREIDEKDKEIERLNNIINVFDGGISYKTAMKMLKIAKKELIKQKIRTWWKIS